MGYNKLIEIMVDSLTDENKIKYLSPKYLGVKLDLSPSSKSLELIKHFAYFNEIELNKELYGSSYE